MFTIDVPDHIATCPVCRSSLVLAVTIWDEATRVPTEAGCALTCLTLVPDEEEPSQTRRRYRRQHATADHALWPPVLRQVYDRFARCCRVEGQALREQRLVYEPAARPEDQRLRDLGAPLLPGLE